MLWLLRQAHVHGTLEFVASGALSRATRPSPPRGSPEPPAEPPADRSGALAATESATEPPLHPGQGPSSLQSRVLPRRNARSALMDPPRLASASDERRFRFQEHYSQQVYSIGLQYNSINRSTVYSKLSTVHRTTIYYLRSKLFLGGGTP